MRARRVGLAMVLLALLAASAPLSAAFARFLGMQGPQIEVNSGHPATEDDGRIAVASDAEGRFVVAWGFKSPSIGTSDVYVRRYGASGDPLTGEILVNTTTTGSQGKVDVAAAPDGRFVVAWSGPGADGSDVFVRRFDASGTPQVGETPVNLGTAGEQVAPSVAMAADGSFAVAWLSQLSGGQSSIVARRFDANGVPSTVDLPVLPAGAATVHGLDVGSAASGGFAVAFGLRSGADESIGLRLYGADGVPASSSAIPVTVPEPAYVRAPSVGMASDGRVVVAWQRSALAGTYDVFARRYASDGQAAGGPISVATGTGDQVGAAVAVEPDGEFTVAWSGSGANDGTGIYYRRFAANGSPQGAESIVNQATAGAQTGATIAANATGNFVVAWMTVEDRPVRAQRFAYNNPPVVGLPGGRLTYRENAGAVLVDAGATVEDVDSASFAGGSLVLGLLSSGLGDVLAIRNQGSGAGQIGSDGTTVRFGGQRIGSIAPPNGGPNLRVDLEENATLAAVQALVRNVTFANDRHDVAATSRTLTVVLSDGDVSQFGTGAESAIVVKAIDVVPVDDPPVAGPDAYRVTAGQTLSVAAPGVLASDSDVDSPARASVVRAPTYGTLSLAASGAFTYTPFPGASGADSFVYRPNDGPAATGVTVSLVIDPIACTPRPPIRIDARAQGGVLAVTLLVQRTALAPGNSLVGVSFGDARNSLIEVPAQAATGARSGTGNFALSVAPNATELRFTVRRLGAGAAQVPLTVTDGCGAWQTFVGGGVTAF